MWPRKRVKEVASKIALQQAAANLEKAKSRTPEVKETTEGLRNFRERNHIVEQLVSIMGGIK
jgi:hypothetical protein